MKKQPTSVRWDQEKLDLVKKNEKLDSVQKVFTFLLDKYWWESKITTFKGSDIPTNNSYENKKPPKKQKLKDESAGIEDDNKALPAGLDKFQKLRWLRENS